jgi:transcriptional regulator of nitric oxide reductase
MPRKPADAADPNRRRWRGFLFQALRVAMLGVIVYLVREQHVLYQAQQTEFDSAMTLDRVKRYFPAASELSLAASRRGGRTVADADGSALGFVIQTSPASDPVTGYSGSTNTLIALDAQHRIVGMEILYSGDTVEHVRDVRQDEKFMTALTGLDWNEAATRDVDAVSGATLTSLAIVEGIRRRLGSTKPSLRFPEELTVSELKPILPAAARLAPRESSPAVHDIFDANGKLLGAAIRTSPAADDEMGYQGPTDTLIALDATGEVAAVTVRTSYDNEPYVSYVRDDRYFRELFNGMTLEQLAEFDPRQAEVEGVSGATMTSMAVAYGLPKAAKSATAPPRVSQRKLSLATRDWGTLTVLVLALLMAFTRLRGYRWARVSFQLGLIGYFGFLNGDLLSQALLAGWSQSGVPWRLAPGLALLTAAALVVPIVSKKQPYCHHICPFGAAQQLIRNRLTWKIHLPRAATFILSLVPAALLVVVLLTAMLHWPLNLASIEPFDAFLFWIAGSATLAIAAAGLCAAAFVPMAYCRFGCPTGALLNYLRFSAHSDRFTRRDAFALGLLALTLVIRFVASQ